MGCLEEQKNGRAEEPGPEAASANKLQKKSRRKSDAPSLVNW